MTHAPIVAVCAAALPVAGCGLRTESSVTPTAGATPIVAGTKPSPKDAKDVIVTENDIANRPYVALGDISVIRRRGALPVPVGNETGRT